MAPLVALGGILALQGNTQLVLLKKICTPPQPAHWPVGIGSRRAISRTSGVMVQMNPSDSINKSHSILVSGVLPVWMPHDSPPNMSLQDITTRGQARSLKDRLQFSGHQIREQEACDGHA